MVMRSPRRAVYMPRFIGCSRSGGGSGRAEVDLGAERAPIAVGNVSIRTSAPVWGASTISPSPTTIPTCSTSAGLGAEEDEVAGLERLPGRDGRAGVVLRLRGPRQLDPGGGVGGLGEPGAVEATPGALGAPLIRGADLRERVGDRRLRRRRAALRRQLVGRRCSPCRCLACGVEGGPGEHLR